MRTVGLMIGLLGSLWACSAMPPQAPRYVDLVFSGGISFPLGGMTRYTSYAANPVPLTIRIYQLANDKSFLGADISNLATDSNETLQQKPLVVENLTWPFGGLLLGTLKLEPDTHFIGAVVQFQDDRKIHRAIFPVDETDVTHVRLVVENHAISFVRGTVPVAPVVPE